MKKNKIDYPLIILAGILLAFGVLVLSNVSADFSQKQFGSPYYYFFHQITFGLGIGVILAFAAFKTPLSFLKKWSWVLVLINMFFMVLVFIPGLGVVSGGASRWLDFRIFSFQPSEFLKLTFILYLSSWLSNKTKKLSKKDKKNWRITLFSFIVILVLIFVLLYSQSDASTLILIGAVSILMYFLSKPPFWHNIILGLGAIGAVLLLIFEPYRMNRILIFLGLLKDPMGAGYQINQALITIGSGGFWGLGLGMSSQKVIGLLPQLMSDSIFAIIAEETGFIGSFILVFVFLFFLWRIFMIAKKSKNKFFQLFSAGFGSWICIQAFVNIGAIVDIIPLTGIPLPFISYGGSHIVAELIGLGILLHISKKIKR